MLKNNLVIISLLLPIATLSATAQAGSTITDKSYWPNEARPRAQYTIPSQDRANFAFAYDLRMRAIAPAAPATNAWRYQGGPKSR